MRRTRLAALLVAVPLALSACGSSQTVSSESGGAVADRAAPEAPGDGEFAPAPGGGTTATGGGTGVGGTGGSAVSAAALAAAATDGRDLIRTASLTVRVDDVDASLGAVGRAVAARGGFVAGEQAFTSPDSPASASLTLRVPTAGYEALLGDLAGLGTVLDRSAETVDVTEDVVDVASRVATAQAALARVRALLDRATSIADIVVLEGELTSRQSELESLLARQRSLADRTTLSTVSLQLLSPEAREDEDDEGFVAGLRAGWDAFTDSATVLVTAAGAVLPFAVLAAVLVGVGLGVRRAWPRRRPSAPQPTDT